MNIKLIIEEELTTHVYGVKYSIDDVFKIGKIYYPNLKIIDGRFYQNYPKNKGSHSLNSFISLLSSHYINYIYNNLKGKVNNLTISNTTNSIYFKIGNIDFRISDHKTNYFNGNDIRYNLFTELNTLLNKVYKFL